MRFFATSIVVCLTFLHAGCFSTGTKVEEATTSKIQKGVTTKTEAIALLGNPLSATFIDGGKELLTWSYGQTRVNPAIFIPAVGLAVEGSKTKISSFQIIFNRDKIVEDTLWNSAEVGSTLAGALRLPASKASYATDADTLEAKNFVPKPNNARLYVYRESRFVGSGANFQFFLDGRQLGVIASGSFACIDLAPKRYVVRVSAENTQDVALEAVAGKTYFIKVEPRMGAHAAAVNVSIAEPAEGEKVVRDSRRVALDFQPETK